MTFATATNQHPLLAVRGLTKAFRGLTALKNYALEIRPGEILGVIGPNGSGKSTLFNLITGFTRPNAGEVCLDGHPIHRLSPSQIVRLGIARTFQGTRLFPSLTVRENIAAAAQLRHRTGLTDAVLGNGRLALAEAEVADIANDLLGLIGLERQDRRRAGDLAYGDQRRLELARALATGPRLLMLDEPAAGMDSTETRGLLRLIEAVQRRFDLAVIVVEHDMNLCERIQVLAHGELIFEGTPTEVQASPRVRETYLGHA